MTLIIFIENTEQKMKDLKTRFEAKRVAVINLEDEIKELKEENSKLKTNATLGLGIHIGAYTVKPVLKATCVIRPPLI